MFTLSSLLIMSGFFVLYGTSQKAELNASPVVVSLLPENTNKTKILGLLLFLAGLIALITIHGVGTGIGIFFMILMTVGSSIVILHPFQLIKYHHLAILFLICLCTEFLL